MKRISFAMFCGLLVILATGVAISALLLLLPPNSVVAKSATVGIYAIIDQVAFEPTGSLPNFLRISGVFVVPVRLSSGSYQRPQKGYLYFRIAPGTEQATRRDWRALSILAGSGKVVAFGQYWVPNHCCCKQLLHPFAKRLAGGFEETARMVG